MIDVSNLSKSYGDLVVLDDIHLQVHDNEIFGIIGQSGAGKSTLLDCMMGLEEYDSGSINIDGQVLHELNDGSLRQLRQNMAMVAQSSSLMNRKNIFKNISLPMELWGYSKDEIHSRVNELAEMVGIKDKLDNRPSELSGGQRQRVAIARALTMEPKYLFCDESTSALDPRTTESILGLLVNIWKNTNTTIIMVTHEMSVIQRVCNRMALLDEGKIALSGNVQEIFLSQPKELNEFLGTSKIVGDISKGQVDLVIPADEESKILWNISEITNEPYHLIDVNKYHFLDDTLIKLTLEISKNDSKQVGTYLSQNNIKHKLGGVE